MRLRPHTDTLYASQSRTALTTERDSCINDGAEHGLFVHQTRLLSRYRYLIDGKPPCPVALSNVEQHTKTTRRSNRLLPTASARANGASEKRREGLEHHDELD